MSKTIAVIKGDGIGPSVVDSAIQILDRMGCGYNYVFADAGSTALEKCGSLIPEETISAIEQHRIVLKGPLMTPIGEGFTSVNVSLRQRFNLYANVRPAISFEGTAARYDDVNIVTVRENTEGMYSGIGQSLSDDGEVATATSRITQGGARKIAAFAYELARKEGRRKVTIVHKANILKSTSGLFLRTAREVAEANPDIETQEMIVDNTCMQLVMNPAQFDVILTTNLFGDIISDLCAGLVGGLGMVPGANIGENCAIFEAVHGSAPDIAGKNIANPSSMILAAVQMLQHLGEFEKAERVLTALRDTIKSGDCTTRDLGGSEGTTEFTKAVLTRL